MIHTIQSAMPMENFVLGVKFTEGAIKLYDLKPLFSRFSAFATLEPNPVLFAQVKVDEGGHGVSWNEELDLSADVLWEHGWPEWREEELVTVEIEVDDDLLRQVTEKLKPYGLTPEDWAVMALELLVYSSPQQK